MSMNISQSLLPEFDVEIANTRKTLERVPEGNPDFRPHPKSMTLARLAGHVAEIPMWGVMTLTQDELDMNPVGGSRYTPYEMSSRKDALAKFDEHVKKTRDALASTTDETMMKTWTLKNGGQTVLALPRVAVMRSFVMNHMVHHRAQLGVYLRMNDVPVPSIYGPSADERRDVSELRIERATARDVPLILSLIKGLAEYERLADEAVATESDLRESLFGPHPGAEVAIAYRGDEPVGFALWFHSYSTFLGRAGLYLEDLFVVPQWRGRGIGGSLLV